MRLAALAFLGCIILCGPARAQATAELFYWTCLPGQSDDACVGYIKGVIAGLQYGKDTITHGQTYCIPMDVGYTQALLMSRRFIEAHPELLNKPVGQDAAGMISLAMVLSFPCRP